MTFKSPLWRPISFVLSAANLVAVGFAAASAESWHAGAHAALALAFGLWFQRLGQSTSGRASEPQGRLDILEDEVGELRRELSETQERMDFAERLLAQERESRRVGPDREQG